MIPVLLREEKKNCQDIMERSDSAENFFPMSTGNVRNLAKLFESAPQQVKKTNLIRLKSKSSSSIVTKNSLELYQSSTNIYDDTASQTDKNFSFRHIHSKFETGRMINRSTSVHKSTNSLECLKLQEIKEISQKTDEIVTKIKKSVKLAASHYITYLNEIVELLLKIGQVEAYGNVAIQQEKLSTLQVLQKCYAQLREKLEVFLVEDSDELEEHKVSIRASIEKWETMMDSRGGDPKNVKTPVFQNNAYVSNGAPKIVVEKTSTEQMEVVRSTDADDDEKILENIKIQNLKNLWERRASSEEILSDETAINQLGGSSSVVADTTLEAEENTAFNEPSTNILREMHSTGAQARREDEVTENADIEDRNGMEANAASGSASISPEEIECFILEEKKSSSENLEEPAPKEANEIQVEFLPEATEAREVGKISEQTEEDRDVNEGVLIQVGDNQDEQQTANDTRTRTEEPHSADEPKSGRGTPKESDGFLVEEVDVRFGPSTDVTPDLNVEENLVTIDKPDENGNEIPNDTSLILAGDDSPTKTSTDGQVLSKEKQVIADTEDFLNEERKSSQQAPSENGEFLVGEIDTKFGPPTGIIPSLNPEENQSQHETTGEAEEEIPDNAFLIIVDKPDENGIPNDTSLTLVGEDSVQTEIQDYTKTEIMANGDKDIVTK